MKPSAALLEVQDLASSQWGLITSMQARELGVTKSQLSRFAAQGYLERLRHGVYAAAGAPFSPRRNIQAAWLALQPEVPAHQRVREPTGAVVSHAAAANLLGLGDVDADLMEFTSPVRRQSRSHDVKVHVGQVDKRDKTQVDGLPTTTAARTVQDLAAAGMDGGHLASIVRDAISKADVPIQELAKRLEPHAGKYGETRGDGDALVERFLDEAGVPQSSTELAGPQIRRIGSALEQMAGDLSRQMTWPPESRILHEIAWPAGANITDFQGLAAALQDFSRRISESNVGSINAVDLKRMSELLARLQPLKSTPARSAGPATHVPHLDRLDHQVPPNPSTAVGPGVP